MKVSKIIGERFRENPSDSNTISYSLLIRGGYIKQMSSGIFFKLLSTGTNYQKN